MKKLIAISVVFALVVGAVFAVDLSGEVNGTVYVLKGDNSEKGDDDPKVFSEGTMNRIRLQGEAANDDGTFGGWIRAEEGGFAGHAWWKPIDQFKLWIGSNGGDGFFGKEGNTGWMFYQRASDNGVTMDGGNVWGNGWWHWYNRHFFNTRHAFYAGGIDGANALYMTVNPIEVLKVNLEIPFFDTYPYSKDVNGNADSRENIKGKLRALIAQVDLNFDFGNIALTYQGATDLTTRGKIYGYFGLGAIDKLALDVGVSFTLPGEDADRQPLGAGLGAKVDITDAFGLKARVVASFAGEDEQFGLIGDILPYFGLNDNIKIFLSGGLGMTTHKDWDDPLINWHINPFVWIGQEWGPSFWAGFKLYGFGKGFTGTDKAAIQWEVPIALGVSF